MKLWQFEKCVKTPRAHLSKLSKKNFRRCANVNLWNKNRFKIHFPEQNENKQILLHECKEVSNNLWTKRSFWGRAQQFSLLLHELPSPLTSKWSKFPTEGEIKSKPVLPRLRFCAVSAFIRSFCKSDFFLALLLICHQHLQLDSWGIRSLLLIYWRSADKRHLRLVFTICDTDFKGCHPLMWLCTSSKALSEECQCSGSCCLKIWCFLFWKCSFHSLVKVNPAAFFCSSWHFVYHTPQGYLLFNQWNRCIGLTLNKAFIFFFNYIP